jgi:hypothetical protein
MGTKKRLLAEIAASASPALRQRIAERALVEAVMGRKIECCGLLRESAIGAAVLPESDTVRAEALSVLDEVGLRDADRALLDAAGMMSIGMKDRLSELALIGHMVVRGPRALIEAVTMLTAMDPKYAQEKTLALDILIRLGTRGEEMRRIFRNMARIGLAGRAGSRPLEQLRSELMERREELENAAETPRKAEDEAVPFSIDKMVVSEGDRTYTRVMLCVEGRDVVLDGNRSASRRQSQAFWQSLPGEVRIRVANSLVKAGIIENSDDLFELDRGFHASLCAAGLISAVEFRRRSKPPASDPPAPTHPSEAPADASPRATLPSMGLPPGPDSATSDTTRSYAPAGELPQAEVVAVITSSGLVLAMPDAEAVTKAAVARKVAVSEALTAEELRKADLKGARVTKRIMYRLICVECFRLATSKAIIGNSYKPLYPV